MKKRNKKAISVENRFLLRNVGRWVVGGGGGGWCVCVYGGGGASGGVGGRGRLNRLEGLIWDKKFSK